MIRIEQYWLARDPIDMRAGMETMLGKVVAVFGAAQAHHAYLFTNRRGNRIKVLITDGFGVWVAARRLHDGGFTWTQSTGSSRLEMTQSQFDALVLGLPWQRVSKGEIVRYA